MARSRGLQAPRLSPLALPELDDVHVSPSTAPARIDAARLRFDGERASLAHLTVTESDLSDLRLASFETAGSRFADVGDCLGLPGRRTEADECAAS